MLNFYTTTEKKTDFRFGFTVENDTNLKEFFLYVIKIKANLIYLVWHLFIA